ncbi:hypothetical protein EW026_g6229 [Hermanssonia centrifuga]|uniref:Uncharacterized protein n=1 Tax=Hermanssonia centrifuga TaxID=98765 RepID=A0A4S4KBM8_9APHY|nr:hypothetical protein EW026_g6229 [Hermanssonia centrifuga]
MMEGHPDAHCKLRLDKVNSAYNKITVDRTLYYGALLTFILSSDSKHNIEIVAIDIPKLIIGFKSKEDISHYVHKVMNPKLGDLRSVDKVEYAVLGGEYGKYQWLRKLPDSEDWKETGLGRADLWRF